nr:MAG TPA: hypothetical protein [Caudoviricetes sp.]
MSNSFMIFLLLDLLSYYMICKIRECDTCISRGV